MNRKSNGGKNFPQSIVGRDLSAMAALLGGMLMAGSSRIQSRKDSKVNYNIAVFFFLILNKFFINGVTAISSYQYLRRESTGENNH